MIFNYSKILFIKLFWYFIIEPITLAILVGIVGVILGFTRFAQAGRVLAAGAILALAAFLLTPLGALLLQPLEDRFPQPPADMPAPTGIIVLGGALTEERGQIYLNTDGTRMTASVELVRRYPSARLVFTGGPEWNAEAISAKKLWLSLGVPGERMMFEYKSRNTWENAVFTRDLVKPKKGETWLLVTSAWHMPRSAGIFRRIGFDVVPYPVAYHTSGNKPDLRLDESMIERVIKLDCSVHEWIGLLAYWLAGKTDALFPAP